MASIINAETFIEDKIQPDHNYWVNGTVEVTLRGETRRVKATKGISIGGIKAHGMTGRYQTGSKAWPATAEQVVDPRNGKIWDRIDFGRDDRCGKFQKTSALCFA